jgi:hypothetical protein
MPISIATGQMEIPMTKHHSDLLHASWIEEADVDDAIEVISSRVREGRIVGRNGTVLTVEYGSSVIHRLMAGRLSSRWFPMKATLSVGRGPENRVEVAAVAEDTTSRCLGDISMRRGEPSISERAFIEQFGRACCELDGSTQVHE